MGKYDTEQSTKMGSAQNMRLNMPTMDNAIRAHGYPVELESAMFSPNRSSNGVPVINDTNGGNGLIFLPPITTEFLLFSHNSQFTGTTIGDTIKGTVRATTTRNDIVAIRDRVTLPDSKVVSNLVIKINKKDVTHGIDLRYKVVKVLNLVTTDEDGDTKDLDTSMIKYGKLYPTEDLVNKFVSVRMLVLLRYYVIDMLRESRAQYENDSRQDKPNRDRTELPTSMLLRREDMYMPTVLGLSEDDGKTTDENLNSEIVNLEDDDMSGFFNGSR